MLIIQALSQLRAKYGPDVAEIIRSNCNLQVFLATNDNETAEYFSKICGEKTIKDINSSVAADGKVSESYSLSARALITPSELLTLQEGVSIAKLLRTQPARVKQTAFWKSKAYYKGEQVIETKWNPNLFVFDKDGFYDIVERNKSEVDYVINDITKYDVKELIDARNAIDEEEDGDEGTDDRMEHVDQDFGFDTVKEETQEIKDEPVEDFFTTDATSTTDELNDLFGEDVTTTTADTEVATTMDDDDFNFDDIDFNFDDILNDSSKEDEIAEPIEITNVAYKEVAEELGVEIDENEYASDFDIFDDEFLNLNTRK
jgi:hypothetical protein